MKKSALSAAIKGALGVTSLAMMLPAVSMAQQGLDSIEEVVVTGSRIKRADLESVSPLTSIGAEEFKISGNLNVEQKLAELPSTLPSFGPSSNNPGDGTARVDLRGLGTSRTLVLVNGRRYIPATQAGVVDLNTIPGTLIKNVDVVTGGASAVYGSDALAGVVNFTMIDDFEGVEVTGLWDQTSEADGQKYNFDITMGGNFADGKGNATVYASYSGRDAVFQGDREFSKFALTESGGELVPGGSSGVPGTRVFGGPTIDPDGIPNSGDEFGLGTFGSDGSAQPWVEPDSRFNYAPDNYLQLPQERYLVNSFAHYEIAEGHEVYSEFAFAHNKVPQQLAPTPAFTTVEINPNSAFLDQATRDALAGETLNANGNYEAFIGRRMVENGPRQAVDTRDAFRLLVGLRGDISDAWSYDVYYSRANLDQSNLLNNDVAASRFKQAVATNDAGTACQDTSGGCVPMNIFGAGNISSEAVDFVNVGAANVTSITQEVFQASANGTLVTLPAASNPVGLVVGVESRADESTYRPDSFLSAGDVLGFNAGEATVGSYSSRELFGEIDIPLVEGAPFADSLSLWGAYRYSDYSNIGGVSSYATTLSWAPVEMVKLRTGYQRAVRAPNVSELFLGSSNGFPGAVDPCSAGGYSAAVDDATCIATGVAPGQVGVFAQANTQIESTFGGNAELEEETSNTFTFGAVIQPMDNLDIAIDYYSIEIDDAISVFGGNANNVLNICYTMEKDVNSPYCSAITRRADNNVDNISLLNANIGKIETAGVDFNVNYSQDLDFGIDGGSYLTVQFLSTYLQKFDVTPVQDLPNEVNECAGTFGNTCGSPLAEWQWNTRVTWASGPLTLSSLVRYIGETDDDTIANEGVDPSTLVVPKQDAKVYLDLSAGYAISDNFNVNFGIKNILDTEPTYTGDQQEQANTFPSTYDVLGPRYFVSASYKFQ
ncbi:TonB-dependent receptor plug domain-containing protein [Simiduia aestuariiviva]|uniref:Outer membrane receptor protein involved in Fe transport n=1 Tax=Simiduia aestuariiviva TaxID=1510459 RepID=A0A839UUZ1_9GAMM|nr:TonB-dependent receptor [Simiduia aestuariiviva]MBB3169187.1 outer membrane receptor protein involved in Fe transport [Simiduia aestuariiviva]